MDMLYMVILGKDWKWKSKKNYLINVLESILFFQRHWVFCRLNQSQTLCQVLCLEDGALENDKASRTWDNIGTSWDAQKKVPWQYPNVQWHPENIDVVKLVVRNGDVVYLCFFWPSLGMFWILGELWSTLRSTCQQRPKWPSQVDFPSYFPEKIARVSWILGKS